MSVPSGVGPQLPKAQALLAAIVESSDDAIISKSLDGVILSWNAAAERIFGYTAEEAIGMPITTLIPEERAAEEAMLLRRLRAGERITHFETVRVTKDGRRVDISLTVSPVRDGDGKIIGASKIARDVTETRRAAAALAELQEELKVVTDNMAVVVTRLSHDMRYLWVSPGAAAWLGKPANEIVGKRIHEVIGDAAFAMIQPYIDRVMKGLRVEFETEVPYAVFGSRWIRAVYVPTHSSDGRPDGWVAVINDTTSHHLLENALREADRRKDEFLAVLAHELRNPLAPIRNSLHLMRKSTNGETDAGQAGAVIERQVDVMVRLVDDLLEVSRITRGQIDLRQEELDLGEVLRNAVETSLPLVEEGKHELSLNIPHDPLVVRGDRVRLSQVFANIINNAAKFTDRGGRISVSVARSNGAVAVAVGDNGVGIPASMLPHVFDLFAHADRTANRARGGLGIGLALAKRLVEMHGGTLTARSGGSGLGSEFVVQLPLSGNAVSAGETASEAPPATQAALGSILVVDDNADAAESLAMVVKMLGASDVRVAYSGAEALKQLENHMPTAILLDIGMPGMDGHEVARRIREQPQLAGVRLIALTGWGQDEDRRKSRLAGFDHHLIKPADIKKLKELLF